MLGSNLVDIYSHFMFNQTMHDKPIIILMKTSYYSFCNIISKLLVDRHIPLQMNALETIPLYAMRDIEMSVITMKIVLCICLSPIICDIPLK